MTMTETELIPWAGTVDDDEREHLRLRPAEVDDRDRLILLAVWDAYRHHGGTTYRHLMLVTGISRGSLGYRIVGYHHQPWRETTTFRKGGGLVEKGLLRVVPTLGGVIMPGPNLVMLNKVTPYEVVPL